MFLIMRSFVCELREFAFYPACEGRFEVRGQAVSLGREDLTGRVRAVSWDSQEASSGWEGDSGMSQG